MVRSGRHAAGEWTFEGGSDGASPVETDGFPPVIHRGAYDGARKRVDVLRQFGWYRRSSGFCPMVGTEAVFLFRFAPAQLNGHLPPKWQHHTIASARFAGPFPPMLRFGTLEIHKVFLRIPNPALTKNLSANLLAELYGAALKFSSAHCPFGQCAFLILPLCWMQEGGIS